MRSSREGPIPSDYGALIAELDDLRTRIATLEAPSGEALGNALPRIQLNVDELLARRTYSAEDAYGVTAPIGTTLPYDTGLHASIPYTITERRRVYFRMSLYIAAGLTNNGSGPAVDPRSYITLRINNENVAAGTSTNTTSPVLWGGGYVSGQRSVVSQTQRCFIDDYAILDPGDYIASAGATITDLDGTSGQVLLQFPRLAVQIGEKVV